MARIHNRVPAVVDRGSDRNGSILPVRTVLFAMNQSKEKSAWTEVRAAADPDAAGGQFYGTAHLFRGAPRDWQRSYTDVIIGGSTSPAEAHGPRPGHRAATVMLCRPGGRPPGTPRCAGSARHAAAVMDHLSRTAAQGTAPPARRPAIADGPKARLGYSLDSRLNLGLGSLGAPPLRKIRASDRQGAYHRSRQEGPPVSESPGEDHGADDSGRVYSSPADGTADQDGSGQARADGHPRHAPQDPATGSNRNDHQNHQEGHDSLRAETRPAPTPAAG